MKKSIHNISDSYLCSACGACFSVCPKNAITYSETTIGRKYALIDEEKCIDCGICRQVCPSANFNNLIEGISDKFVGHIRTTYVGRATDIRIYENAQSGGVCTALLKYLFDTNRIDCALVSKMEYGETPQVHPFIVKCASELYETQKSNYTQIELLSVLNDIKQFKSVAIVGLPCHIEALQSIQINLHEYSNITYKLGLVCDRSMCSIIQNVYKEYASNLIGIKIGWKSKKIDGISKNRYANAPITIYDKMGNYVELSNIYRFSLKEMFTPPKCRTCVDKLNIFSDITLGDPWKMSGVDKEDGDSLVMVRTEKGQDLVNHCINDKYLKLNEADLLEAINGQNINQRRLSTKKYSDALVKVNNNDLTSVNGEIKTIISFINSERRSKEEIIKLAKRIVKKAMLLSYAKGCKAKIMGIFKH